MSKGRYFTALSLGAVLAVVMMFVFGDVSFEGFLIGLVFGVMLAELIFWTDSLAVRVFLIFARIAKVIFLFWLSLFADGIIIFIIIALVIASGVFAAIGAILSVGFSIFYALALVLFIYHVIAFGRDLY